MPSRVQIDSQGRVKLNPDGLVILADEGDPCCCGGGASGEPCECVIRLYGDCPGDVADQCCSALEYDAVITASGSAYSAVDPSLWRFQTNTQSGLFYNLYGFAELPDPPPTDGVLVDLEWSIDATVSVRCVKGVRTVTSTGSYYFAAVWYAEVDGVFGMQERFESGSWTDGVGSGLPPWFGATASRDRTAIQPIGMPVNMADFFNGVVGAYPPVTAPASLCSETYGTGSLTFEIGRAPIPGLNVDPLDPMGRTFVPFEQAAFSYTGSATGSNSCDGFSQSASFSWDLFAAPSAETGGPVFSAGSGSQSYSVSVDLNVLTDCDPDPCDLL